MIHHRDTEAQRKSFLSSVECPNTELFGLTEQLILEFGFASWQKQPCLLKALLCASVSLW